MNEPWRLPVPTPEQQEKRNIRRSANFCGILVLAMTGVQYFISVILTILMRFGVLDSARPYYGMGNTAYCLLNMLIYVLFLPVPVLGVALITRNRINPFPTRRVKPWLFAALVAAGMGMAILANVVTSYVMTVFTSWGVPYPQFTDTMEATLISLFLNILTTAVLPALVEEMIFRGYLQGALRPYGEGIALVLAALIFGLFHGNVLQFPFAFLLGLMLGWVTVQTGSIWPAVLIHFGNNLMSVLLDYFGKVYPNYGEGTLTMVTFLLVSAVGVSAMGALLITDRGGTARQDVLRPVGNGVSLLSVRRRVFTMLTAPVMIIAMAVMILTLLVSMVAV